jgi:hypothetical protein
MPKTDWPGRAPERNTLSTTERQTLSVPKGEWAKKTAYARRMTEFTGNCPRHIGVTFAGYHVATLTPKFRRNKRERVFECSVCGHQFFESQSVEADPR